MAYSGGVFTRLYNWVTDLGNRVMITASRMDAEFDGIATALSTCVLKDGSQTITANLPMNSKKLTGLAAGTTAGDSVRYEQAVTAIAVTGGTMTGVTIENSGIGAVTPAAGKFTTLQSTGAATLATVDGILGSVTPAAATVTSLTATGTANLSGAVNITGVPKAYGVEMLINGGVSTGTDTQACTPSPAVAALAVNQTLVFTAGGTNTGACTMNVSTLGATSILREGARALQAGDILAGGCYFLRYDSTRWILMNPSTQLAYVYSTTYAGGTTSNLVVSGIGFKPKSVILMMGMTGAGTVGGFVGWSDGTNHHTHSQYNPGGADVNNVSSGAIGQVYHGAYQDNITAVAFAEGTATFTRTNTGGASGTVFVGMLFLG